MAISTDCIGSCKSNYYMIMTTTAQKIIYITLYTCSYANLKVWHSLVNVFYKSRESGLAATAVTFFTVLKNGWVGWTLQWQETAKMFGKHVREYIKKNIGEKEVLKTRKKNPQRLQLGRCDLYFYISLIKKITHKYVIVFFFYRPI